MSQELEIKDVYKSSVKKFFCPYCGESIYVEGEEIVCKNCNIKIMRAPWRIIRK